MSCAIIAPLDCGTLGLPVQLYKEIARKEEFSFLIGTGNDDRAFHAAYALSCIERATTRGFCDGRHGGLHPGKEIGCNEKAFGKSSRS